MMIGKERRTYLHRILSIRFEELSPRGSVVSCIVVNVAASFYEERPALSGPLLLHFYASSLPQQLFLILSLPLPLPLSLINFSHLGVFSSANRYEDRVYIKRRNKERLKNSMDNQERI